MAIKQNGATSGFVSLDADATTGGGIITSDSAAAKTLVVRGAPAQSVNLFEVQDSASVTLFSVSSAGVINTKLRLDAATGRTTVGAAPTADSPLLEVNGIPSGSTGLFQGTAGYTTGSNVLDVTAVTSGTVAVGQYVSVLSPITGPFPPGTYVESLGTGSGGVGTYILSHTAATTLTGQTVVLRNPGNMPILRLRNANTAIVANEPMGGIEFYGGDTSTDANHVRASIAAISEDTLGAVSLVASTASASGPLRTRAVLDSAGLLSAPAGTSLGPWTTWSPFITGANSTSFIASGSNATWSNAKYVQIGKTVIATAKYNIGSTTTFYGGGARFECSLPVNGSQTTPVTLEAWATDSSTGIVYELINATSTQMLPTVNSVYFRLKALSGSYMVPTDLLSTTPFTWAVSDSITFTIIYEAA